MRRCENHVRACSVCYNEIRQKGKRWCNTGVALAQDIAEHVYFQPGEVYSKKSHRDKLVRVELLPRYPQTRELLEASSRKGGSTTRRTPIISYDPTYPVKGRRSPPPSLRQWYRDHDRSVHSGANNADRNRNPQRPNSRKPRLYDDYIESDLARIKKKPDARRGPLYDTDIRRVRKHTGYWVENAEPMSQRYLASELRRDKYS